MRGEPLQKAFIVCDDNELEVRLPATFTDDPVGGSLSVLSSRM